MHLLDQSRRSEIPGIIASQYYQVWIRHLEKVLTKSRQEKYLKDPLSLIALQISLARSLAEAENNTSKAKNLREKAVSDGDLRVAEDLRLGLLRNKAIARAIKIIADGIAWRVLGYDRPFLRIMAEGKRNPGSVDLKDSYLPTQNIATQMAAKGSFVLLNDITYYLRVGDLIELSNGVTVIHELKTRYKNGKPKMMKLSNVYSLRNKNIPTSQEVALIQAQIVRDVREIRLSDSNETIKILDIPINYNTHLAKVKNVIKEARIRIFASHQFDSYLFVSVTDFLLLVKQKDPLRRLKEVKAQHSWRDDDIVIPFSNLDQFHDQEGDFIRNATPYSVFPFSSKTCIDLIAGNLWLESYVNISEIRRIFSTEGWVVSEIKFGQIQPRNRKSKVFYGLDEARLYPAFTISKENFTMDVSWEWVFWVAASFVQLKTLIELANYIFALGPQQNGKFNPFLIKEKETWK